MVTFDFTKTPITQIADYIIMHSSKSNASDIHFDPREDGLMIRLRVDGELQDYTLIPKTYERNLTTRLKLLANMNITESRLPQDGAIKGEFGGTYLDMRVSCLPTNLGEKIVIRILDYSRSLEGMESLGFSDKNYVKLRRMIAVPNGIILITGATGSGKSTTVYSVLQELNNEETNIITVEDPIEMNIEGLNQVQVNAEIGLDFASVLRSILRQDPNVILIGEIRDSETAKIAVRSSITGHLVLSTIHTNNSLSTIERLLDMDVERYLLSTALTGIISQRLAKMLCKECRVKRPATEYEKKIFKIILNEDVETLWDASEDGCEHCHKGYRGRIAVQEVLELDDDIRDAINDSSLTKEELRELVYTENVTTLLQDGLEKALNGTTSFEEIYRIIEIDVDTEEDYAGELKEAKEKEDKETKEKLREKRKEEKKKDEEEHKNEKVENKINAEVKPTAPETKKEEATTPEIKEANKNESEEIKADNEKNIFDTKNTPVDNKTEVKENNTEKTLENKKVADEVKTSIPNNKTVETHAQQEIKITPPPTNTANINVIPTRTIEQKQITPTNNSVKTNIVQQQPITQTAITNTTIPTVPTQSAATANPTAIKTQIAPTIQTQIKPAQVPINKPNINTTQQPINQNTIVTPKPVQPAQTVIKPVNMAVQATIPKTIPASQIAVEAKINK